MTLLEVTFLEQFLLGLYLGVVTGILPGVVAWTLGFIFKYFTRVTIPALGVTVVAVGLAGVQGGLLGLLDVQGVTAVVALLVVTMISIYCHSQGDKMGAEFPHRVTLKTLKDRTLPKDVIEKVGRFGQVRIKVVGEVIEMEGYAPISEETKRLIKNGEWTFPADLSVSELENRMAERLVEEFELSDVSVSIDTEGNATVIAAPSMAGLSKRVPSGKRAVSFETLVPTGLARGDKVTVEMDGSKFEGTVVSAMSKKPDEGDGAEKNPGTERAETDGGIDESENVESPRAPSTTGGEGRVTVAVDRTTANELLLGEPERMFVNSRGTRREYELVSVLKSAGKQFRKVGVASVGEDETIGSLGVRENFGVIVLAVKRGQERILAPRGDEPVVSGDDLFVVGNRTEIDAFEEVLR